MRAHLPWMGLFYIYKLISQTFLQVPSSFFWRKNSDLIYFTWAVGKLIPKPRGILHAWVQHKEKKFILKQEISTSGRWVIFCCVSSSLGQWFSNLHLCQHPQLESLVTQISKLIPRSDSDPRICICDTFSGDADVGALFLHYENNCITYLIGKQGEQINCT